MSSITREILSWYGGFAMNPAAYDPRYHFELAIEAGCNAYAAPLGFIEVSARTVK